MSFPRYPKYKDSGVEWLGEVPEHWTLNRIKYLARSIEQGWSPQCEGFPAESEGEWGVLKVGCVNGGTFNPLENKLLPPSLEPLPELAIAAGDLLISRANTRELVGSAAVAARDYPTLMLCDKLYRVRFNPDLCLPQLLSYYLGSTAVREQIELEATGASSSMLNIGQSAIMELVLATPPPVDQRGIASFLDRETAKIDGLVEEQRRLMELLKEKRQAVISHAVTKGLNPHAPMKPSGIEWLGDLPEHWRTTRLKHATKLIVDCPHDTPTYSADGTHSVIRTADLADGRLDESAMYRVEGSEFLNRIRRASLQRGDIVYGREGERWGHAALVPEDGRFCLGQRMMQFRAADGICPAFLMWQMNARSTYTQGDVDTVGATSPHVNVGTIRNYYLTEPPFDEQQRIGAFLTDQARELDTLTAEAQRAIDLLQERRTALISSAVTGQIDVRGIAETAAA